MALWQFSVVFIPASWTEENSYNSSLLYGEEGGYDTECAWKEKQPKLGFQNVLSEILPPSKAWHNDLLTWGDTKQHDIQVWYEYERISGIRIRLDLRQSLNNIIVRIIRAAKTLDCKLFFPEFRVIVEANEFELKSDMRKSNAARFVTNPQEFLGEIN